MPAAGAQPAAAFTNESGPADSAIQIASSAGRQGYSLRALIPLDRLRLAPGQKQFRFEVQLTSAPAPDAPYEHRTLFGSRQAHAHAERFALAAVEPRARRRCL